ncbi:hypothetical protein ACFO25_08690 [Paenactinomyces guangxiensis]|uniref:Uncharacterized protein n=1 Tax=Paenactinomyces guangxiensis TaxID=1490290 RepID=A0A7W1WMY5_9BACL|nr:hypothetical protein [Paenactinomyces guangxiensis]MBA4492878.1 hypothetical protein [Paenactinomyces guangxiensis]MBH8590274.1 hypothetical protein [Paenactinomyces guangxiensis]
MNPTILITGKVKFRISLDPSIWIIDDRHFPLSDLIPGTEGLAMKLAPFLQNAEPSPDATHVICHRSQGEPVILQMKEAAAALMCFAKENKPIRDGGPALLYLADGSNKEKPVDFLTHLEVVNLNEKTGR